MEMVNQQQSAPESGKEAGKSGSLSDLFRRNPLLKLLAINGVTGLCVSLLFMAGILAADVGHLRSLIMTSEDPIVPLVLLAGGLIITMTSVVMGTAVMMLKPPSEDDRGGGGRFVPVLARQPELQPVRVPARIRRTDA